ncbi:hypothetical protein [Jiella sp. M17.18]|uniref:hypothetical protein n=1 Tax=Jiella sp. M17.18 TaxID=3234247 RepID=UPI0034DE8EE7
MHMVMALRGAALCGAIVLLSSCTSTDQAGGDLSTPDAALTKPAYAEHAQGGEAMYCPQVTLREGTSILTKMVADKIDYQASIQSVTRDCRIVDGQFHIVVGVIGRMMPGPAATSRSVSLPIRVAVTRGQDVVYSALGKLSVPVEKGGVAHSFSYVDNKIVLPVPTEKDIHIFTGFDDGAPAAK